MDVYDPQTRSQLQTDQQFPSVSSQKEDLIVNPDTSVDIYFGPEPPLSKEANWVQTISGKGWWVILRLYGPLEPWFDKTWRPGEIELVKLCVFISVKGGRRALPADRVRLTRRTNLQPAHKSCAHLKQGPGLPGSFVQP
jgi:hypothetical protein